MRLQSSEASGPIQLMQGRTAYDCAMSPAQKISDALIEADARQLVDKAVTYVNNLNKIGGSSEKHSELTLTSSLALTAICVESKTRAEQLLSERYNGRVPLRVVIGVR